MKKTAAAVIPLLLVVGAILIFRQAQKGPAARDDDDKPPAAKSETNAATAASGVVLASEVQQRAGLKVQPLLPETLAPAAQGFGSILDPAGLVALDNELSEAETALKLSEAQVARAQTLFDQNQSVPQKTLESAEAQVRIDRNKLRSVRRKLELDWGTSVATLDTTNRVQLVNRLLQREIALARVEVPPAEQLVGVPSAARITAIGNDRTLDATILSEATTVDPHTQGRAFLLRIDSPPTGIRPGTAIEAQLATSGPVGTGWQIPNSAIVRHLGHTWIYLQKSPDKFTRTAVTLQVLSGDHWFSTDHFDAQDRIVVTGAQVLLSEELKSQLGTGD